MHSLERRNIIMELLASDGTVLVNSLSNYFSVSEVTIRTDLRVLEKKGVLTRFHGGATLTNKVDVKSPAELPLEDRYQRFTDPKKRIALEAIKLVKEGDTIILDSGSTTLLIAVELAKMTNLTVITNSIPAAQCLAENNDIMLFLCGGLFRYKTRSLHGKIAEQSFTGISADILFVGADGIDSERGITTFNEGHHISEVMANAAKKVVAVLDSSKFGKSGFNIVVPLSKIDTIITDNSVDPDYKKEFSHKKIKLLAV